MKLFLTITPTFEHEALNPQDENSAKTFNSYNRVRGYTITEDVDLKLEYEVYIGAYFQPVKRFRKWLREEKKVDPDRYEIVLI